MIGVLFALLLGLFGLLVLVCAACGSVWFLKPEGIRPPWWNWGLDKKKDETHEEASDGPPE